MAHWHDFNPWAAKLIYLPDIDELATAVDTGFSLDDVVIHWLEYGHLLDAYIIQGGGQIHAGVRYGKKPHEYLSPSCRDEDLWKLFAKYHSPRIELLFWLKPIPLRNNDWSAALEGSEGPTFFSDGSVESPGDPVGYGATEAEAVKDLMEQLGASSEAEALA